MSPTADRYFEPLSEDMSIARKDGTPPERRNFHIHDLFELTFVYGGHLRCEVANTAFDVLPNTAVLFNNMDLHRMQLIGSEPFRRYVLCFRPDALQPFSTGDIDLLECFLLRPFPMAQYLPLSKTQAAQLRALLDRLCELNGQSDRYGQKLLFRFTVGEILVLLNDCYRRYHGIHMDTAQQEYRLIYDILQKIHARLQDPLPIDALAREHYLSKRRLTELFKKVTGQTPAQYILHCRIQKAKSLLNKGLSVDEVCGRVGFGNLSNFSRTFKQHVGLSPKQYALRSR